MTKLTLNVINQMAPEAFAASFADVWERTPSVAAAVASLRPFESVDALHAEMLAQITSLERTQLFEFLNLHPELAGSEAKGGTMTSHSTEEQGSLSLHSLGPNEAVVWDELNRQHRARFGYPFILCVRQHDRDSALADFRIRVSADAEVELARTLDEIRKISRLRLADLISDN